MIKKIKIFLKKKEILNKKNLSKIRKILFISLAINLLLFVFFVSLIANNKHISRSLKKTTCCKNINYSSNKENPQLSEVIKINKAIEGNIVDIYISFDVLIKSLYKYRDKVNVFSFFQTAYPINGMRMDINYPIKNAMSLVTKDGIGHAFAIKNNVQFNKWYSIKIHKRNINELNDLYRTRVWLDDVLVVDRYDSCKVEIKDIVVGGGVVDQSKPFDGEIKNFTLEYTKYLPSKILIGVNFNNRIIFVSILLFFLFIILIFLTYIKQEQFNRFKKFKDSMLSRKTGRSEKFLLNINFKSFLSLRVLIIVFMVTVILFMYLFMAPLIKDTRLLKYVHAIKLGRMITYENGDTPLYIRYAQCPSLLLVKDSVRQSRPLYTVAGYFLGKPIIKLFEILKINVKIDWMQGSYAIYQLVYIFINFLVILLSIYLFILLFNRDTFSFSILILSSIFVTNELVKTLFWTATPTLFSIFIPIITIFLSRNILVLPNPNVRFLIYCFLVGICWLLYGGFVTSSAVLIFIYFILYFKKKIKLKDFLKILSIGIILSIIPTLIWMGICAYKTGRYYNHEVVVYRQLVWIFDVLKEQGMLGLLTKSISFLKVYFFNHIWTWYVLKFPVFLLIILSISAYIMKINFKSIFKKYESILIPAFISLLINFVFYYLLGFYGKRFAWTLVGSVMILAGVIMKEIENYKSEKVKNGFNASLFGIFFIWLVYVVLKDSTGIYWGG